ncbi:MAG: MerR family transcriptional regulator [Oscillospiraceae bacterium]|nr:MerR family transcriptional regulator [Oscillospiraceae bacterium]
MTIAEVSKKFGVTADTLRYYERIGILPPVPRTKGGIRDYDEDSCRWIELMKCLRSAGVQIEALTEYSALYRQGDATMERRKEILVEQRAQLEARMGEIQNSLDRLNYKIANYEALLHGKDAPVQCIKA